LAWRWAAWAAPGVVLAAAYLLWLYQRVFFGTVTNPKNEKLHDLTPREILTFAPLIICAFWIGLYPKPFFQILESPVNQIVQNIQANTPTTPVNAQVTPIPAPVPAPATAPATATAQPNAAGLPINPQNRVILSGATASQSEAVAQSKDPYPLNLPTKRQGILPMLAPTKSVRTDSTPAQTAAIAPTTKASN